MCDERALLHGDIYLKWRCASKDRVKYATLSFDVLMVTCYQWCKVADGMKILGQSKLRKLVKTSRSNTAELSHRGKLFSAVSNS